MKYTKMIPTEIDVVTLDAHMNVRHTEDAYLNGEEDTEGNMPLLAGDDWHIQIDLESGQISNWPKGTTAKTHYKVCDSGVYRLYDKDGNLVEEQYGYVPSMLGRGGYGDYVILEIDENGIIQDWDADLSYFEEDD